MLKAHGDWMDLGGADEQKPAKEGTVEAWGRSPKNPVGAGAPLMTITPPLAALIALKDFANMLV